MNTYNINDIDFINSDIYKEFKKNNPSYGYLRIRAYYASGALPINNMKIIVKTKFNDNTIIFYEGKTDQSGVIERIKLPAPKMILDNLVIPDKIEYEIDALYPDENFSSKYLISMYEGICVVQNINVPPRTLEVGAMWQ